MCSHDSEFSSSMEVCIALSCIIEGDSGALGLWCFKGLLCCGRGGGRRPTDVRALINEHIDDGRTAEDVRRKLRPLRAMEMREAGEEESQASTNGSSSSWQRKGRIVWESYELPLFSLTSLAYCDLSSLSFITPYSDASFTLPRELQ